MSKFTDYIDGFADKTVTLAKDDLKELITWPNNSEIKEALNMIEKY